MKNTRKLLAAVAVSAFLAVSASAFAAETTTTTTTTETVKTVHHKHHHHMAHHKAAYNKKMACKQDKHGKCLHFFSAMGRGDDAWMGTRKAWQNTTHD